MGKSVQLRRLYPPYGTPRMAVIFQGTLATCLAWYAKHGRKHNGRVWIEDPAKSAWKPGTFRRHTRPPHP